MLIPPDDLASLEETLSQNPYRHGAYRVPYTIDDDEIVVQILHIDNRADVHR